MRGEEYLLESGIKMLQSQKNICQMDKMGIASSSSRCRSKFPGASLSGRITNLESMGTADLAHGYAAASGRGNRAVRGSD